MGTIRVQVTIEAPPHQVWEELQHIDRHVRWMHDAESIRFTSRSRRGVGTTFDCRTKVGPIRLTDRMEVTTWRAGQAMGVRHVGVVTGTGRFTLRPAGPRATLFSWEERLRYPWWLGGPIGGAVGDRVLRRVWRRNLRALKRVVEGA